MGLRRCETDRDSEVLRHIVALLVSLAALAERAADLSGRRHRAKVLGILMWGEAEARAFVIGLATSGIAGTHAQAQAFADADDVPFSRSDAAHLAVRLRALALILCLLLADGLAHAVAGPRFARKNADAGLATVTSARRFGHWARPPPASDRKISAAA